MPEENLEVVRRMFTAFAGPGDEDEFERRFADANLERFFDPEVWEQYAVELQEIVEAGDQVVAVMRMAGRTHDVDVDELWSSLHTLREGRIVRVEGFASRRGAFEAAGLRE